MAAATQIDWSVTEEKISELVRRIVEAADPLDVIAFGSRARFIASARDELAGL